LLISNLAVFVFNVLDNLLVVKKQDTIFRGFNYDRKIFLFLFLSLSLSLINIIFLLNNNRVHSIIAIMIHQFLSNLDLDRRILQELDSCYRKLTNHRRRGNFIVVTLVPRLLSGEIT